MESGEQEGVFTLLDRPALRHAKMFHVEHFGASAVFGLFFS